MLTGRQTLALLGVSCGSSWRHGVSLPLSILVNDGSVGRVGTLELDYPTLQVEIQAGERRSDSLGSVSTQYQWERNQSVFAIP